MQQCRTCMLFSTSLCCLYRAVPSPQVPLSYHVPFGLLEWCIAVVAAHTATRRTLGAAAAAAMTRPLWLLLHLAVYYALPCAMVAQIEAASRQRFRCVPHAACSQRTFCVGCTVVHHRYLAAGVAGGM